jgi:rhomboid protease GluP
MVKSLGAESAKTFAEYLASQFITKKGFTVGTVPEANRLLDGCDIVLSGMDFTSFTIICIIDCEANPGKKFEISRDIVEAIGLDCLKYSGAINRAKMPMIIKIMEIGNRPIVDQDRERLKNFKRKSIRTKVNISTWIVDPSTASVWTNAPFNGRMFGRPFIEKLMREPRDENPVRQPIEAAIQSPVRPFLTYSLIALLIAVFGCEQLFAVDSSGNWFSANIQTLVALGGLTYSKVFQAREWYRIFSATLLHLDLIHLLFNSVALYMAGVVLETLVGRAWFFALFVLGAVSGSLMSLAINSHTIVSVGASGAIMGLMTAGFICSFRLLPGITRTRIQVGLLQVLIPSMIPLAVIGNGHHTDYGAHLGGALSGGIAGFILLKSWPTTKSLPTCNGFAKIFSFIGLAAFAFAFFSITRNYGAQTLESLLIPDNLIPKSANERKLQSSDLVARYPRDPRAHLFRASNLIDRQDANGAISELRTGLREREILDTRFSPSLELDMKAMLALLLSYKGEYPEAKTIGREICTKVPTGPTRDQLNAARLCN